MEIQKVESNSPRLLFVKVDIEWIRRNLYYLLESNYLERLGLNLLIAFEILDVFHHLARSSLERLMVLYFFIL